MSYVLINSACDGRHIKTFNTKTEALQALANWFGTPLDPNGEEWRVGRSYYSDWGNRLTLEERPDGWTTRLERDISIAFDARECGSATKKQMALLARHSW